MTIQRYDCVCVGSAGGYGVIKAWKDGDYVLYIDHLAVVAEKEREWKTFVDYQAERLLNNAGIHDEERKDLKGQIATLTSDKNAILAGRQSIIDFMKAGHDRQIAALTAEVEYMDALTRAKIEAEDKWAKVERRIKELTEALEMLAGHDDKFVSEIVKAALEEKP